MVGPQAEEEEDEVDEDEEDGALPLAFSREFPFLNMQTVLLHSRLLSCNMLSFFE